MSPADRRTFRWWDTAGLLISIRDDRLMTHSSQWHSSQKMRTRLLSESCLNTSATVWKLPIVSTDSCSSRIVPSSLCWWGKCTSLIVVPPFFSMSAGASVSRLEVCFARTEETCVQPLTFAFADIIVRSSRLNKHLIVKYFVPKRRNIP